MAASWPWGSLTNARPKHPDKLPTGQFFRPHHPQVGARNDSVEQSQSMVQRHGVEPTYLVALDLRAALRCYGFGSGTPAGRVIGIVAAVVYGGVGLAVALSPGGVVSWSRNHPRLDGAILGPLLFLALAFIIPSLSAWWCLLAGVVGIFIGIALGGRRDRLRAGGTSVR
jgi:hypothetical protein